MALKLCWMSGQPALIHRPPVHSTLGVRWLALQCPLNSANRTCMEHLPDGSEESCRNSKIIWADCKDIYRWISELYDAESKFPIIVFPMPDRSNQVQIVRNAFTKKYSVTRAVYAAGHVAENMYLDERTHGLATMSGAFGDTKKECLRLVQVTADEMMAAGL